MSNRSIWKLARRLIGFLVFFLLLPFLSRQGLITPVSNQTRETGAQQTPDTFEPVSLPSPAPVNRGGSSGVIENAYRNRTSNLLVTETGTVSKLLADDNTDSRHQRFIVTLQSGHPVLIAHNIDLAPRISTLHAGDTITFSGQYEWNDRGGVVHWTHHDPSGRRPGGYLLYRGMYYQ